MAELEEAVEVAVCVTMQEQAEETLDGELSQLDTNVGSAELALELAEAI